MALSAKKWLSQSKRFPTPVLYCPSMVFVFFFVCFSVKKQLKNVGSFIVLRGKRMSLSSLEVNLKHEDKTVNTAYKKIYISFAQFLCSSTNTEEAADALPYICQILSS